MADIRAGKVQTVVVYKIDRLTRSLSDFARLIEPFEARGVSFVSVTQQFNTTTSMGRLMLNVLLSFAQFEREVTGERIRSNWGAQPIWSFRTCKSTVRGLGALAGSARSMEHAGLPRSVANGLGGWKSDSMYNRYAIVSEADLRNGVRSLSAVGR